jgi:CheY-like chemotaxis protein
VVQSVTDTGVGMEAATLARNIDPILTPMEPAVGRGLGLAVVEGIVRQHRGTIAVESAPGQGSTFRVYLPRVPEPAPASAHADRVARAERSATVLVVEDDDGVRELAGSILAEAGYTVLTAAGSREALALLEDHAGPLDLLLTDVVMPEMNGPALAEHVRCLRPGIRVVFMSGYAGQALGDFGLLDAGITLIPKPFTPASLTSQIAETLRGDPVPPAADGGGAIPGS